MRALVTTDSGKVLCMETGTVYVSFDPSFDPEVTRIIPEGECWGQIHIKGCEGPG